MKAFVKLIGYSDKSGRVHIRHSMREKTQRKELEGNPVKVIGESPLRLLEEGFTCQRSGKKGRPVDKPLKEFVVSEISVEQAIQIKDYLEKRFTRTVYGVFHDDESKPHCHYMMKAKERETDKALRLDKKELHEVYAEIGQMVGHELTPYGQGRPAIPFRVYTADPEYAKERIKDMTRQDDIIRRQVKQILDIYGVIDLYALSADKGRFTIKEGVKSLEDIPLKRLKGLNLRGEGILFKPHGDQIKGIFIDDVARDKAEEILQKFNGVLVQTSQRSFQLHVTLEREQGKETVEALQRALTEELEGDPASVDTYHLRRLPGFSNPKHLDRPYTKIVLYQDKATPMKDRDIKRIVEGLQKSNEFEDQHLMKTVDMLDRKDPQLADNLKSWNEFFDGDRSVADLKYTIYLIAQGLTEKEVSDMLKAESPSLLLRKKGHVNDYIERTLHNAKHYLGIEKDRYQGKIRKDIDDLEL